MITVHKFGPAFGLPDASPFVVKVETYLRLTGQKYTTLAADVRKAPRRQFPCIDLDGKIIADSSSIIDILELTRPERLNAHLSASDDAIAFAFKALLEEELYFGLLYLRWMTDSGWAVFEPTLRDMLGAMGVPSFMRGFVAARARAQVRHRVTVQGLGRRSHVEILDVCTKGIDALSEQLGAKVYFCGDRPTTYDATVYAFVEGVLCPAFDHELRRHAATKANLVSYAAAMHDKFWQD